MLIKGILKSWFWISLHQGTLSIFCSRIQGYMLSLMNEVNPCSIASAVCFVWDAKPDFATKSTLGLKVMLSLGNEGPSYKGYKMRCLHPKEVEQHGNHISANIILTKFEYSVSSLVSGIFTNFLAWMQLAVLVGNTVFFSAINFAWSFSPKLKDFMVLIVKTLFFFWVNFYQF